MFLPRLQRPRDLAIYCLTLLGMYLLGSLFYSEVGQKFTEWVANEKLPAIEKDLRAQLEHSEVGNFSNVDFSNVNWSGIGNSGGSQ
jgi:prophage antirepressor-like protein